MEPEFRRNYFFYAFIGGIVSCVTIWVTSITIYPGLRELISSSNLLAFALTLVLPSVVAGGLIAKFSRNVWAATAGFLGIAVGVIWHLHLAGVSVIGAGTLVNTGEGGVLETVSTFLMNVELLFLYYGGLFAGLVMLVLPIILGLLGVKIAHIVNSERGA